MDAPDCVICRPDSAKVQTSQVGTYGQIAIPLCKNHKEEERDMATSSYLEEAKRTGAVSKSLQYISPDDADMVASATSTVQPTSKSPHGAQEMLQGVQLAERQKQACINVINLVRTSTYLDLAIDSLKTALETLDEVEDPQPLAEAVKKRVKKVRGLAKEILELAVKEEDDDEEGKKAS